MANRLKAYVKRTILEAAKEYSYPKKRRTPEGTRQACVDAVQGVNSGWWRDLLYVADRVTFAYKYRRDIVRALSEYEAETGEPYRGTFSDESMRIEVLHGLNFAVEWYASQVQRELCPDGV